jgi:hypothetical protein
MLHHSITAADFRMKEKRQKSPLGVAQSRVLRTRILYCLYIIYSINSIYRSKGDVFFSGSSIATVAQRVHLFILISFDPMEHLSDVV